MANFFPGNPLIPRHFRFSILLMMFTSAFIAYTHAPHLFHQFGMVNIVKEPLDGNIHDKVEIHLLHQLVLDWNRAFLRTVVGPGI